MIKTIGAMGGIGVEAPPPPYINTNPNSGAVRYNTMSQNLEVFDGYSWVNISTYAQISLSPEVTEILNWARDKMQREQKITEYAKKYPFMEKLCDNMNTVQSQIDVALAMVSDPIS